MKVRMSSKAGLERIGCLFNNSRGFLTKSTVYSSTGSSGQPLNNDELSALDPKQLQLLEEQCILVDHNDNAIGSISKKEGHLMENINKGLVHRAFSVFLFNTKGDLLIQQRSDAKITFPGCFTNTCCSHPLYTNLELEEKDAIGVRRAAQRRLNIELGINPEQLHVDDFTYLSRIQYKAASNGRWGESEIDYILVAQKDLDVKVNPNEVKSWCYIKQANFKSFLKSLENDGHKLTPWFLLISNTLLQSLWNNLHNLSGLIDHKTIHRL